MPRRKHRRRRRRSIRPSPSIAGYTRLIDLEGTSAAGTTVLSTEDVPDVVGLATETVNRKLIRVGGQAMFAAALAADQYAVAQFCLWAHPSHESWPTVADYDPFSEGPGETGFEGLLSPRTFCRRTFVLTTPASGVAQTIETAHMIRSKAERLLRPGWKLTAGLYLRGSAAGIKVRHTSLLRYVVAG